MVDQVGQRRRPPPDRLRRAARHSGVPLSSPTAPEAVEPSPSGSERKATLKAGATFAAAAAFQRALTFLLLPLFTSVLTPAEYGRLSVALSIYGVTALLLGFGLDAAVFREYVRLAGSPEKQAALVATLWRFLMVIPIAVGLVVGLIALPLIGETPSLHGADVLLAVLGAAIFVAGNAVPLAVLRADQRLRDYVILNGIAAFLGTGLTLFAVVYLDEGVTGWLLAVAIANAAMLVVAIRLVPFNRAQRPDGRFTKSALQYGMPLLPHFVAMWGLQLANRLVLAPLVSPAQLGIFSLAANVALPVMILVQGLNTGFMPSYAKASTGDDHVKQLDDVIRLQIIVVIMLTVAGAILGPAVVRLFVDERYQEAQDLVPWIALGYGLLGLYCIPMNLVTLKAGQTKMVWRFTLVAVAANFGAILATVPTYGIEGAAIAMAVGYSVLLVGIAAYARSIDPIRIPWTAAAALSAAGLAAFVVADLSLFGSSASYDAAFRVVVALGAALAMVLSIPSVRASVVSRIHPPADDHGR